MTLTRRVLVRCPHRIVVRELRLIAGVSGGPRWSLSMRAPVRLPSLGAEIVLSGETIARLELPPHEGGHVAVAWEPPGGDAFPRFAGRLWSEAETLCTSWLRLEGDYEISSDRLRIAERAERTIGHRIAVATAKLLLVAIAETIVRSRAA